jgi:hypothetical protein
VQLPVEEDVMPAAVRRAEASAWVRCVPEREASSSSSDVGRADARRGVSAMSAMVN